MPEFRRKEKGEHLKENRAGELLFLTFPSLMRIPFLIHGFSTRLGGVSEHEFSTMNLSFTRGDNSEAVKENYNRIAAAIGFSVEDLVLADQKHTTNVRLVTGKDRGKGFSREKDYQGVDALITNDEDVILTGLFADCVPIYFVDPVHRAVGLAHSGWRGTVNDIAGETVKAMTKAFSSDPADLIAAIGPSICRDCYEVDSDVIDVVKKNFPSDFWSDLFEEKEGGKFQFDLWETCRFNLLQSGMKPENIAVTDLCTCCNSSLLFSHRASKGKRGNLGAFVGIRRR